MKADRLLSILLLLQANGRMSAGTLARRLEVSRRTIYRDLEALGAAGVPVVTDHGPQGGASLLAGWRTDVTGLTESELSALLAFSTSAAAADLGLGEDLGRATQKLAVAAGRSRAGGAPSQPTGPSGLSGRPTGPGAPGVRFQDRVLVDNDPWAAPRRVPPHLACVQDALWSDRRLIMRYRRGDGQVSERVVEPYGLVAKNGTWYLLAGGETGLRTYRVSRLEDARVSEEAFVRPPGFDLERAWSAQAARLGPPAEAVTVTVAADPVQAAHFYRMAAGRLEPAEGDTVRLSFPHPLAAAAYLASFGATVRVLDPPEVSRHLAELGAELIRLYQPGQAEG